MELRSLLSLDDLMLHAITCVGLCPNTKKQNNCVPLVITYSKALPNIHEILKKNMKILYNSEKMKSIFDEPPIVSYK
jgi:hypothetical protein